MNYQMSLALAGADESHVLDSIGRLLSLEGPSLEDATVVKVEDGVEVHIHRSISVTRLLSLVNRMASHQLGMDGQISHRDGKIVLAFKEVA